MSTVVWKRPLVIGASGQVGAVLCEALAAAGANEVVRSGRETRKGWLALDLVQLDGPHDAEDLLGPLAPDAILCCGGMTFVDGCEQNPQQAFRANAHGPSALASYARHRKIPFVYFSSDYVFDGTDEHAGPYAEADTPAPLNVYGKSKLQAERAVMRVHPEALVIRTSWVYGPDAGGKNFVSSLVRQLRAGQRVRVAQDQVSTPTLNRDLARASLELMQAGARGVFHVTGPELMSRAELALRVATYFSLPTALIEPRATADLGQIAPRPVHSGLRSERLPHQLPGLRMEPLEQGLATMAASLAEALHPPEMAGVAVGSVSRSR